MGGPRPSLAGERLGRGPASLSKLLVWGNLALTFLARPAVFPGPVASVFWLNFRMTTCSNCNTQLLDDSLFCPRCGTPIAGAADDELLASSASDPTGLLDRIRRATAGEFTIMRELGRGGIGRVYLAHETALDRRIAMKVLPPALAEQGEIVQRFQREARTAGKLSHPHIVPVYQVSERAGLYFFTMPYVAGPSLRQILSQTPQLSVELARRYLREAADALSFAHAKGLIHRDIKPENMLMEGSRDGRLMLTDFGIAKAIGTATTLTRPGDLMGTPYFMSPEQCEEVERIDGRSDQYSLGLVGYEMLAGRFPFSADSLAGIVYKHLHEYPKPLVKVRPDLPSDLLDTIERAIRKDPDERFPSMGEFMEALGPGPRSRRGARSSPVAAKPRAVKRQRRSLIGLAAAAAVVILASAAVVYQQRASSPVPSSDLLAERDTVSGATDDPTGGESALSLVPAEPDSAAPIVAKDTATTSDPVTDAASTELENARREAGQARDRASRARQLALDVGADSVYPDRFASVELQYVGAEEALEAGQVVTAAAAFGAATQAFSDLAEQAGQRLVEDLAARIAPDSAPPAGEDEPEVPDDKPTAVLAEDAIAALVATYRLALESEDLARLEREVYRGAVPESDGEFLRLLFDRGDEYSVEIEPESFEVGDSTAEAAVLQKMQYRLSRSRERRNFELSLRMFFESSAGVWRLVRIDGFPR